MTRFQRIFGLLAMVSLFACGMVLTAWLMAQFYHRCWATIRWTEVPYRTNGTTFTSHVSYFGVASNRIYWGSANESGNFEFKSDGAPIRGFYLAISQPGAAQKVRVEKPADVLASEHPNIWFRFVPSGSGYGGGGSQVPFIPLTVLCAVATFICLIVRRALGYAERADRRPGICEVCGYSLTANTSGTCPECGTPVPSKPEVIA